MFVNKNAHPSSMQKYFLALHVHSVLTFILLYYKKPQKLQNKVRTSIISWYPTPGVSRKTVPWMKIPFSLLSSITLLAWQIFKSRIPFLSDFGRKDSSSTAWKWFFIIRLITEDKLFTIYNGTFQIVSKWNCFYFAVKHNHKISVACR